VTQRAPQAPSRWGPRWSRWVGRALARGYWNTEVRGLGNVPADGPVIVAGNHAGLIDGPVVHGVLRRGSHFLVLRDMFRGPLRPILSGSGQIAVHGSGREALAQARGVLLRGDVVGVFPEGTRGQGTAESIQGGAAWLALHTHAPVIPVALLGTRHTGEGVNVWPRPRRRILVEFGAPVPLQPPAHLRGRARQQWAEHHVAQALREHVARVATTTDIKLPADVPARRKEKS
jgi:1-acyl-sn-glycerol-3-phosphate acyltransferase